MEQDIIKTTFDKVFEAFPLKNFEEIIRSSGSDRYIKKMKSVKSCINLT